MFSYQCTSGKHAYYSPQNHSAQNSEQENTTQAGAGGSYFCATPQQNGDSLHLTQNSGNPDYLSVQKSSSQDGGQGVQKGTNDSVVVVDGGRDYLAASTVPVPVKRRMSVQVVAGEIVDKV